MSASGYGHFTTMQVRRRAVRGLQLHLQRLVDATRELMGCGLDAREVTKAIVDGLDRAGLDDATVRLTVCAGSPTPPTGDADDGVPRIVPRIEVSVSSPLVHDATPIRLRSVLHRRTLPHIKHVGTFASHHHRRLALRDGVDDALFVDADGRVLEGTFWNVGFWRGDAVVWPDAPALRGTGERLLRDGLAAAGVPQSIEVINIDELAEFAGAFIVNARGVRAVGAIGDVGWLDGDDAGIGRLRRILGAVPWNPLADWVE